MLDMTKDDISNYWCELQSYQSNWAFRAYDQLVSTLSVEVQERLKYAETSAEPYVVIFGKTQVGKTTLLLDLMGIEPQQIPVISKVLRGGRAAGKSATATAMEYCRSVNGHWGMTLQSETHWFDTDDLVTHKLGALRAQMEDGMLPLDAPCVLHIPNHFFAQNDQAGPAVRILDLPGDNPGNEEERKYVNLMAKTYLPFADLILLVGRGDDLSFLRQNAITLPGIEDWQAMPYRFRIVTTYSYSAQSVKDLIRKDTHYDIGKLRQRLKEQISLFGDLSKAASDDSLYFPLEFGTSWMSMKHNEPELYSRISPLVGLLREELLAQIASSTSQMGRLRGTLNTHLSVTYIQTKKTEKIQNVLADLKKNATNLEKDLEARDKAIKQSRDKFDNISKLLALNNRENGSALIEEAAKNPCFYYSDVYPPSECQPSKHRDTLKNMVNNYYRVFGSMRVDVSAPENAVNYWTKVKGKLVPPSQQTIETELDNAFGAIRSKLDHYTFDAYLFTNRYEQDKSLVKKTGELAKDNLIALWKSAWHTALSQVDNMYKQEQRNQKIKLASLEEDQQRENDERALLSLEIESCNTELNHVKKTSQDDLDRCEQFIELLNKEYRDALTTQLELVFFEDDDCDSLLQLFACAELKNQREDLINLTQQNPG